MCMYDDGDGWDFLSGRVRRARKPHRCYECNRTIGIGENYHRWAGKSEDCFYDMAICEHCSVAVGWLNEACGGYLYGGVQEDLGEHVIGYESELRTRPLTRLYRWMLSDWRNRSGELRPVEDVRSVTAEAIEAYARQYDGAVSA